MMRLVRILRASRDMCIEWWSKSLLYFSTVRVKYESVYSRRKLDLISLDRSFDRRHIGSFDAFLL
jgi:hypothetical protein